MPRGVNGLTELALTKLDILSGLPTIRICVAYPDGDKIYRTAIRPVLPFAFPASMRIYLVGY